jgi:hypothetical protein
MDEHEGVLRVLSQWEDWRDDSPPALETYRVNSATDITKLATLQVQLPRPEVLQSVRFDAERAYAITFEQTDPLFTFDLSDPEAPKQVGELEIPGWVYHMEPRGNRIYAIGFDDENETGALHVSLFDVEDMANPTMLQRVNFGGDWGSFSEDQDRIHKSFKLLDQHGMMVVPFSGHDWDDNSCNSTYLSGIQLVDYTSDALTLRGVAPQVGRARRAFVHEDRLFGVSDDAVQSFDIENRDDIKKLDTLETARNVSTVRLVGDKVLRFGTDWWTERTVLDVANVSELTRPESQQSLDLSQLLADSSGECSSYAYWGNVYTYGQFAYVERHSYSYADDQSEQRLTLLVVDVGQAKPVVIDQVQLHLSSEPDVYSYFSGAIQTTSALLLGITRHDYSADESKIETTYKVLDVREPSHPVVVSDLKVPQSLADQGWGRLSMGCDVDMGWGWRGYYADEPSALVSGDIISSSHAEALPNDTFRARYYLDRFDLSDPENPKHLEKVNIPGRAAHFDAESGQLLSIEERVEVLDVSQDECWDRSNSEPDVRFHYTDDYDTGRCERVQQLMHNLTVEDQSATLQGSVALHGGDWYLNSTAVTGDRIFVRQYQTQRVVEETYEYWTSANSRVRVFDTALNKLADFEDVANAWGSLHARGTRAFSSEQGVLRVFDATDPDAPKSYERELLGYGCEALEVRGDTAVCAQGKKGVELIELD